MKPRHTSRLLLPLTLVLYSAWVLSHWEPVCVAPDTVGLCQQAQHFAESGLKPFQPESPAQLVGTHWVQTEDATYRGRFPPGYPALLGLAYRLVGPEWSLLLGPLFGALAVSLLLLFGLSLGHQNGRDSRDLWPPLLAAVLLATFPLLNRLVLHGDTHVPAMVNILAGIWLLKRWDRKPSKQRAFAAGLAWGLLPSLRYGEAVFTLTAGAFMAVRGLRKGKGHGNTVWPSVAGAMIPLALLAGYNGLAYGSPIRTGYALTQEQTAFSLSVIPGHLLFYLSSLLAQPIVVSFVALGIGALGVMIRNRKARPLGLFLLVASLLSVLQYTSYYWGENEDPSLALRFFLPAMASLFVAITWLLVHTTGRQRWPLRVAVAGLVMLGVFGSEVEMREEGLALEVGVGLVTAARQAVPDGSVLICPRGLGETLLYGGTWRIVPQWLFPGDPQRQRIIVPWEVPPEVAQEYADRPAPMQAARGAVERSHYRGLHGVDLVQAVLTDISQWAPSADVYWLGDPRVVEGVDTLIENRSFRALGYLALPGSSGDGAAASGLARVPSRIPLFVLEPDSSAEGPPS